MQEMRRDIKSIRLFYEKHLPAEAGNAKGFYEQFAREQAQRLLAREGQ